MSDTTNPGETPTEAVRGAESKPVVGSWIDDGYGAPTLEDDMWLTELLAGNRPRSLARIPDPLPDQISIYDYDPTTGELASVRQVSPRPRKNQ